MNQIIQNQRKYWLKYKQNDAEPLTQPAHLLWMLCCYKINENLSCMQMKCKILDENWKPTKML